MLALLSPGQGAQKPGFLQPWLAAVPTAEARLRWWSVLAGVDLVHLGTAADEDEIKDTARTQPLLVATALLAAEQLSSVRPAPGVDPLPEVAVVGGHSVGELAAAALAGALTPEAAVALAGVRGRRWPPRARSSRPGWRRCWVATSRRSWPRSRRMDCIRPTGTVRGRSSRPARPRR